MLASQLVLGTGSILNCLFLQPMTTRRREYGYFRAPFASAIAFQSFSGVVGM